MPTEVPQPTCFIAMPITTHEDEATRYGNDPSHWLHVMEVLFEPAIRAAGFEVIRPVASGSHLIHGQIIKHLSTADMVLCDLSSHNPNVFFELGVRTSLNLPITLVRDEHTDIPFDTSGLNTLSYSSTLKSWDVSAEVEKLTKHIAASVESSNGENPLWRHFGLTIAASRPETNESSSDARLTLLAEDMASIRRSLGPILTAAARSPLHLSSMPEFISMEARDLGAMIAAHFGGSLESVSVISSVAFAIRISWQPGSRTAVPELHEVLRHLVATKGFDLVGVEDEGPAAIIFVEIHTA